MELSNSMRQTKKQNEAIKSTRPNLKSNVVMDDKRKKEVKKKRKGNKGNEVQKYQKVGRNSKETCGVGDDKIKEEKVGITKTNKITNKKSNKQLIERNKQTENNENSNLIIEKRKPNRRKKRRNGIGEEELKMDIDRLREILICGFLLQWSWI